tara:strand:+ start:92 stop:1549 length:1458 start_codon:yes stop_codon:yes gene_type:complete
MFRNKEFSKLCDLSKKFLKKRPYLSNLGNPFLFVVSGHPFILSRYKSVNSKKINFIFIFKYTFQLILNLIKINFFIIRLIFTKNHSNINKNFKKGSIIVSHLINSENFKKSIDTQFNGIEKEIEKNKTIFFYLDHINISNKDKIDSLNIKKNFFINNSCIELSTYKKIIINIIKEFYFLLNRIKKTNNNFEKKFYLECAKYLFSLSTIKNIILFYNLEKLIIKKKITYITITLEGHPYEHLIFLLGKMYKIKVYAYQNTYITKNHFSMFLNLGTNFLPTKILASGKISYDFLRTKFNRKKVFLLGSNKYQKQKKIKDHNNSNCLVIPTGLENESNELLKLCHECLDKEKNLNRKFILRLHPLINRSNFIKKNQKILKSEKRIEISNSKLADDITVCKFVLYRASSAVVEAAQQGLVPIYFYDNINNFQSDALWQLKSKTTIKNAKELVKFLNKKQPIDKKRFVKCINFTNNFYRPINYKKLREIF